MSPTPCDTKQSTVLKPHCGKKNKRAELRLKCCETTCTCIPLSSTEWTSWTDCKLMPNLTWHTHSDLKWKSTGAAASETEGCETGGLKNKDMLGRRMCQSYITSVNHGSTLLPWNLRVGRLHKPQLINNAFFTQVSFYTQLFRPLAEGCGRYVF